MKKLRALLIIAFWAGVTFTMLGQVICFIPGAETRYFVGCAVLCLCGLLVRSKAYSIASVPLVAISVALAIVGYRNGERYRVWLSSQPPIEEQIRRVQADIRFLDNTNAEPDGSANGSQPFRSETNRTSEAAGSRR
jgi:hypothetical protein